MSKFIRQQTAGRPRLTDFVPHARMEVLRSFRKHHCTGPDVSKKFIYLQRTGWETSFATRKRITGVDYYEKGDDVDLMKVDSDSGDGSTFRTFAGKILFTTGELNVLVERGAIRLFVK